MQNVSTCKLRKRRRDLNADFFLVLSYSCLRLISNFCSDFTLGKNNEKSAKRVQIKNSHTIFMLLLRIIKKGKKLFRK